MEKGLLLWFQYDSGILFWISQKANPDFNVLRKKYENYECICFNKFTFQFFSCIPSVSNSVLITAIILTCTVMFLFLHVKSL